MIRLIFAQNLSNLVVLSIKCWAKSIFYLLFLQNVALLAFWGHTFAVWMAFSALQCEEMFAERPFCLFTLGEVFLEHCKKFPRFSNFNLLIQKNSKFWSVCTVLIENGNNTENGKSAKRNLNFVKRRNGGLRGCFTIRVHHLSHFWWKMKCFVIPQHAFFCVMNTPYIDYIKLVTYRHNLCWIHLKLKILCIWIAIDEFSERTVFDGTQTCTFQTHAT